MKKYKKYNYLLNLQETLIKHPNLAYNCSKMAAERGNRDILSKATFQNLDAHLDLTWQIIRTTTELKANINTFTLSTRTFD